MLIPWYAGLVAILLIALLVGRLFAGSYRKQAKGVFGYLVQDRFGIPAVVTLGILWLAAFLLFPRILVVRSGSDYHTFWLIAPTTYETKQGKIALEQSAIINDTAEAWVLQQVVYGKGNPEPTRRLDPYSAILHTGNIHYLADEVPPQKIQSKSSLEWKYWLRRATPADRIAPTKS